MSGGIPAFETMTSRRRRDAPVGHIIQAQQIKDSSYMESMVNFIQDISQVYTNTTQTEEKEAILWARLFNYKDILYPESENHVDGGKNDYLDPLLLVLGYKNGMQAWNMCDNGDMQEILSLRQGPVKTVCLVPPPSTSTDPAQDEHTISRPLLAVCLAADRKQLFTSISIISLRTQEQVQLLKFDDDVERVYAGPNGLLIVTLRGQVRAFDTFNFKLAFTIQDCYPSPNLDSNPIAVGREWLAYAPTKQVTSYQSAGGEEEDGIYSYAATVLSAAKTIKKGLVNLGETVNWLAKSGITGGEEHSGASARDAASPRTRNLSGGSGSLPELPEGTPGLVTIVNIPFLYKISKNGSTPSTPDEIPLNGAVPTDAIIAHFPAHNQPVVCMEFSPCGSLLATADKRGHAFHVFSILPHPISPKMGAVHHLYSLYRGDTSAQVQGISFSSDCRWLSVNTLRGTSHIFPIASYGGSATVRTHVSHRVVNRSSRFHKSAGLEDMDPSLVSVGASVHSATDSPNPAIQVHARRSRTYNRGSRSHNSTNPRLPPHPQPTLVQPLVQIGSSRAPHVLNLPTITGQSPHGTKADKTTSAGWQVDVVVASIFTSGQLKISRSANNHDTAQRRVRLTSSSKGGQCLIIVSSSGVMTEHHLEPRSPLGLAKVSDDSPIELISSPKFQWPIQRLLSWAEVTLPLPPHNPLLEVDSRRRECIYSHVDATSSLPAASATGVGISSAVEAGVNAQENVKEDHKQVGHTSHDGVDWTSPKIQQPSSRNPRHASCLRQTGHKTTNSPYPGTAVKHANRMKPNKSLSLENSIIPMGRHADEDLGKKTSLPDLREQTSFEGLNGQIFSDHHQQNDAQDRLGGFNLEFDEWLAQVEMVSHEGPARRLWMGPQFCFKIRQSTGSTMLLSSASSALISNCSQTPVPGMSGSPPGNVEGNPAVTQTGSNHDVYVDDLDLHSLKIQPNRSDPMPTPKSGFADRFESSSVTIEAGSGSFDRHAHMLEIGAYGSLEDRRFVSVDNDDRLKERIADAMLEHYGGEFGNGGVTMTRDIRSRSESSDMAEFATSEADVLLSAGQFDFESDHPSLELPADA